MRAANTQHTRSHYAKMYFKYNLIHNHIPHSCTLLARFCFHSASHGCVNASGCGWIFGVVVVVIVFITIAVDGLVYRIIILSLVTGPVCLVTISTQHRPTTEWSKKKKNETESKNKLCHELIEIGYFCWAQQKIETKTRVTKTKLHLKLFPPPPSQQNKIEHIVYIIHFVVHKNWHHQYYISIAHYTVF